MRPRSPDLGLEAFVSKVPQEGYFAIQGTSLETLEQAYPSSSPADGFDPSQFFLVPHNAEPITRLQSVLPDESGLFLEFAEGEPLKFANRFGLLGGVGLHAIDPMDEKRRQETRDWIGEPVAAWKAEIQAMAEALRMWAPAAWTQPAPQVVASAESDARSGERLASEINRHLKSHCSLALSKELTSISIRPQTLLSAVWAQFALAVRYDKQFRKCDGCKRWFEMPSLGSRYEKQFCSKACKQRTYRERKSQSRLWFLAGASFEEIAERFGSEPDTVKQWVQQRPFTKAEQRAGKILKGLGRNRPGAGIV
jgi:hypothetical protein